MRNNKKVISIVLGGMILLSLPGIYLKGIQKERQKEMKKLKKRYQKRIKVFERKSLEKTKQIKNKLRKIKTKMNSVIEKKKLKGKIDKPKNKAKKPKLPMGFQKDESNRNKIISTKKGEGRQREKKINLNTASKPELKEISGIGPSTAEKIIKFREEHGYFRNWGEVEEVKGVGSSTLRKIKEQGEIR